MAGGVPNLGLDGLVVDDERLRLKLDPDGGLRVHAELVPRESGQELSLPHRRVPDQDDLEHVVDLLAVIPVKIRHYLSRLALVFAPDQALACSKLSRFSTISHAVQTGNGSEIGL